MTCTVPPTAVRTTEDAFTLAAAGSSTPARGAGAWGLSLQCGPSAPATARREARRVMHAWGTDEETVDDALLVVSELVTNAVQYAEPPVAVSLCFFDDRAILVAVTDGGPRPEDQDDDRPADEHGRGAFIVDAVAVGAGDVIRRDGRVSHWAVVGPSAL
ncbi:ATP-binding protein [Streptomyces sp. NBC_00199]|uniref:ATP-binding protein n=1 Tax=Streptomyces sp. NBC_00199 TaxID=2975678 RepID=UPI002258199B|nr:ATP-binding protein [Streptomyces sp. NBC_00199]MCX5269425.1 ATP-binding protein [Streptomyces sp. NBC_00199]